jgi:hypothetical protein
MQKEAGARAEVASWHVRFLPPHPYPLPQGEGGSPPVGGRNERCGMIENRPSRFPPHEPWEHPTSNIELPTSNDCPKRGLWMFDVGCWMFLAFGSRRKLRANGRRCSASSDQRKAPSYSTAARMVCLNSSIPWSKAAEMGRTGVLRMRRLNFFKFSSAGGSSILLATTRRGLWRSAGS